MSPDINFKVSIGINHKDQAIKMLGSFCVNTNEEKFDAELITDNCVLSFVLDDEDSTTWFKHQYPDIQFFQGKTLIGSIELSIYYCKDKIVFDFWPPFSSGCQACFDSENLKNHFIDIVTQCNGYTFDIIHDGCSFGPTFENRSTL